MNERHTQEVFARTAAIKSLATGNKTQASIDSILEQIDKLYEVAGEIEQTESGGANTLCILLKQVRLATEAIATNAYTTREIVRLQNVCDDLKSLVQLMSIPSCRHKGMLSREQAVLLYAHAAAIYSVRQVNQLRGNQANLSIIREAFSNMVTLVGEIENRPLAGAIETILFGIADAANTMQTDIAYTDIANCAERIADGCRNLMELAKLSQPHDTAD